MAVRRELEKKRKDDTLNHCSMRRWCLVKGELVNGTWCVVKGTHWAVIVVVHMAPEAIYASGSYATGLHTFELPLVCASISVSSAKWSKEMEVKSTG